MEKSKRDFLWDVIGEWKKAYLINWEIISWTRDKGDLGIENIVKKNLALLGNGSEDFLWSLIHCGLKLLKVSMISKKMDKILIWLLEVLVGALGNL